MCNKQAFRYCAPCAEQNCDTGQIRSKGRFKGEDQKYGSFCTTVLYCADDGWRELTAKRFTFLAGATKEFVINLVSEAVAEAMNITCIDAPPGTNELELAKLKTTSSVKVSPPRVSAGPVAFECRFLTSLSFGPNQAIIAGQIVHAYVEDRFVLDRARGLVDTPELKLIGGMHGAKWYAKLSDRFEMERPTWAEWVRQSEAG